MPNEYVAVCWKIACGIIDKKSTADPVTYPYTHGSEDYYVNGQWYMVHGGDCVNNTTVIEKNGVVTVQEGSTSLGSLDCELTLAGSQTASDWSTVTAGTDVEWNTYTSDKTRRWHHKGKVVGTYPGHPLHS